MMYVYLLISTLNNEPMIVDVKKFDNMFSCERHRIEAMEFIGKPQVGYSVICVPTATR